MAKLTTEYIDTKNVVHRVEHFTLPADDKERIMDELLSALTRTSRLKSA